LERSNFVSVWYRPRENRWRDMNLLAMHDIRPYVEQLWGWDQADQERRFRENFDLTRIEIINIDGQDIGYLDVENHDDHVFLAGIYLARQFRRRGVGAELIGDVLSSCRSLRKPLRLRVLRPNPAQHLYARLGFRQVDVTETHIYMEAASDT